jgi:hypothetical protein
MENLLKALEIECYKCAASVDNGKRHYMVPSANRASKSGMAKLKKPG